MVPIGAAHDRGLLHRGVWIGVLRGPATEAELLLLQRSDRVVTCPTAWGLVGEHSAPSEAWESTVRRAVREELGVVDIASLGPLGVPVLFKCAGPTPPHLTRTPAAAARASPVIAVGDYHHRPIELIL